MPVTINALNFGTGVSGQILTSNGAGVAPTFQAAGGGNWVKLDTQNVVSAASVSFSSTYITNTYQTYVIAMTGVQSTVSSSSDTLVMTFSVDNGSNYLSTGYVASVNNMAYNSSTYNNASQTNNITISTVTNGAHVDILYGTIWLYNLASSNTPTVLGEVTTLVTNSWWKFFGYNSTTSGVNNIKLKFTNNISGLITLYGLVQ